MKGTFDLAGRRSMATGASGTHLLLRAGVAWLAAQAMIQPALAQAPAAAAPTDEPGEDIVVTASRIQRDGFDAPTPTTVVGEDELSLGASSNIADALNRVPSFSGAVTPTSSTTAAGSAGQNILSLRGLGPSRTLVLVNGRRHVPSNAAGTFNLNVIPAALVERVEVVTGGASAAWGSDAVAGVVNLILDDDHEGVSGEARYGLSSYGDGAEYALSLTWGAGFAGGRGHVVLSAEHADNAGIGSQARRPWGRAGWQVIPNPAFQPGNGQFQRVIVRDAHISNATPGGLIVSPGPFQNIEFGPGGLPEPFLRGNYAGGSFMAGGDGINLGLSVTLQVPVERQAFSAGCPMTSARM